MATKLVREQLRINQEPPRHKPIVMEADIKDPRYQRMRTNQPHASRLLAGWPWDLLSGALVQVSTRASSCHCHFVCWHSAPILKY